MIAAVALSQFDSEKARVIFSFVAILVAVGFGFYQWRKIFLPEIKYWKHRALMAERELDEVLADNRSRVRADEFQSRVDDILRKYGIKADPYFVRRTSSYVQPDTPEAKRHRRIEKLKNLANNTNNKHEAALAKKLIKESINKKRNQKSDAVK